MAGPRSRGRGYRCPCHSSLSIREGYTMFRAAELVIRLQQPIATRLSFDPAVPGADACLEHSRGPELLAAAVRPALCSVAGPVRPTRLGLVAPTAGRRSSRTPARRS